MTIFERIGGYSFVAINPERDPDKGFRFKMWRPLRWIPIAIMWYDDDQKIWRRP